MTINAPAAILLAFYVCVAERQGVSREQLGGTIQTNILKEYIAQKEWCFPIDPAMRLVHGPDRVLRPGDASLAPGFDLRVPHPRGGIDGAAGARLHARGRVRVRPVGDRHAGSTWTTSRPRLSFFFNAHIDFFEEIAKYRAARRIWAREMRETFGARDPALVADALPQPDGGRVADRAAAAQQRGPNRARGPPRRCSAARRACAPTRLDEALTLPTEEAVRLALRTQQVIAPRDRSDPAPSTRSAAAGSSSR